LGPARGENHADRDDRGVVRYEFWLPLEGLPRVILAFQPNAHVIRLARVLKLFLASNARVPQ